MDKSSPRVFISYSWDSEDHRAWVRKVAEQLAFVGVEVRLDQWHCPPGQSFTQFMEQEVRDADFCVVICTPEYARKADARTGGVGYEQQIISGDLMSGIERAKFIPILSSGEYTHGPEHAIPAAFSGIALIDFRSDVAFKSKLEELLRVIYAKPKYTPPERGQTILLLPEPHSTPIFPEQARRPTISAHIVDWIHLDTLQFTRDLFALADSSEINTNLVLEISAPDLNRLINCVKSQSDLQQNSQIVLEQLGAIQIARKILEAAQKISADLLSNVSTHYGLRVAISCISRYLKLIMAITVYRLGKYQLDDGSAIFSDFSHWFEDPHPAQVAQFAYAQPALITVIISSDLSPKSNDKCADVYLPLGRIENDGLGNLISFLWESCEYIPDDVWVDYVIPQLALQRTEGRSSYTAWLKDSSVYCTEGIVWRGSSSDPEFTKRISAQHTIIPRK